MSAIKVLVCRSPRDNQFHITALEGARQGEVLAQADSVDLFDVEFRLVPAPQDQGAREPACVGHWVSGLDRVGDALRDETVPISFRREPHPCFVRQDTRVPVWHAAFARLEDRAIRALV